jgi:hypothetical protein
MDLQISTNNFTCLVTVNPSGYITSIAPVLRVFSRQPKENLIRWLNTHFPEASIFDLSTGEKIYPLLDN